MKTSVYLKVIVVLLCCGFALAQEPSPTTVTAAISGATISDFKGKVMIQLPGQSFVSPTRGQVLSPESTVNTDDGRLLLKLTDGSDVLVRPHTKLIVKEPEHGAWRYLQLLIGRIRTQVQKHLGGTPGFQIGTPSAVISVRGTRFEVEVNRRGFTQVDVEEGVVELESASGRGSVMVPAGFSSRVGADAGPEVPRPTRELRPQLDRPRSKSDHDYGDDAIRKLELSDGSHSDGSGDHSGSSSGSDGDHSGSSGSDDGGTSGSSGSGDNVSGSGSGDTSSGDGGHKSGDGGTRSGDGGSSDGDHHGGDRHGGKPPII